MTLSFSFKVLLPVIALLCLGHARGQLLQGTIDGNVSDPSHAAVAGAKVNATDEQNNPVRETFTNSTGGYPHPPPPPRPFSLPPSSSRFPNQYPTPPSVYPDTLYS